MDDSAALDAAVDKKKGGLDAPIRGFLRAREAPPPRLLRWHAALDVVEGARQEAAILAQPAARADGSGVASARR